MVITINLKFEDMTLRIEESVNEDNAQFVGD